MSAHIGPDVPGHYVGDTRAIGVVLDCGGGVFNVVGQARLGHSRDVSSFTSFAAS